MVFLLIIPRFLAFGVGLDPRQRQVFGPKLGPLLTACSLALISFSSVGLAPGYPGAGMNPGRCFAFAVARGDFKREFSGIMQTISDFVRPMDMVGRAPDRRFGLDSGIQYCAPLSSRALIGRR